MKVKELREFVQMLPDDMPVVMCGDGVLTDAYPVKIAVCSPIDTPFGYFLQQFTAEDLASGASDVAVSVLLVRLFDAD